MVMEKQKIKIIRESTTVNFPNGRSYTHYSQCDICGQTNYPIFSWNTLDDPYIQANICHECATKMMEQDAT